MSFFSFFLGKFHEIFYIIESEREFARDLKIFVRKIFEMLNSNRSISLSLHLWLVIAYFISKFLSTTFKQLNFVVCGMFLATSVCQYTDRRRYSYFNLLTFATNLQYPPQQISQKNCNEI